MKSKHKKLYCTKNNPLNIVENTVYVREPIDGHVLRNRLSIERSSSSRETARLHSRDEHESTVQEIKRAQIQPTEIEQE